MFKKPHLQKHGIRHESFIILIPIHPPGVTFVVVLHVLVFSVTPVLLHVMFSPLHILQGVHSVYLPARSKKKEESIYSIFLHA